MELKCLSVSDVGFKFAGDSEQVGTFSGYASTFGGVDSYGDTILPGAYKKTIKKRERPILMRWNHYGPVIGKWMDFAEDEKGLFVSGELTPGHSLASDVYASVKHGAVTGLSIGYRPVQIRELGDGKRELKEIELVEVSIVEAPADAYAQIGNIKSALDGVESLKEIEAVLRDVGRFSRADATALVSRIKSIARGEREQKDNASELVKAIQAATQKLTTRI